MDQANEFSLVNVPLACALSGVAVAGIGQGRLLLMIQTGGKYMSKLLLIVFAVLVALTSIQVFAQTDVPGIERRIQVANDRVYDGIRSGRLTRPESQRLNNELCALRTSVNRARRDGFVNDAERGRIRDRMVTVERDLDRLMYNQNRR